MLSTANYNHHSLGDLSQSNRSLEKGVLSSGRLVIRKLVSEAMPESGLEALLAGQDPVEERIAAKRSQIFDGYMCFSNFCRTIKTRRRI